MESYQIPKMEIEVEIVIENHDALRGSLFLSESQVSHSGKPKLESFLNRESEYFFPFRDAQGETRLINKSRILYMLSWEEDPPDLTLVGAPLAVVMQFGNGDQLKGLVYPDLPEAENRMVDFINQDVQFLVLYRDNRKIIFNREQVLYTKDHLAKKRGS